MSRKQRREQERLEGKLRDKLVPLTEVFASRFLECTMNGEQEVLDKLYVELNDNWKAFCMNIINKNPNIYKHQQSRSRLIQAFATFVTGMYSKVNQPLDKI